MKNYLTFVLLFMSVPGHAKIVSASASYYHLEHQARSTLSPKLLWQRLIQPSEWWHPDHTFSGDASNLKLDLQAGGLWREDWDENSVLHGTVLNVKKGESLRLNAPFGPLQELAVEVIWTITIKADRDGSIVNFTEISNGGDASGLDELAKAVDYVKQEAIQRLVNP